MADDNADIVYMNTFQMKPKEGTKFEPSKVRAILKEVLAEHLDKKEIPAPPPKPGLPPTNTEKQYEYDQYSADRGQEMAKEICQEVQEKVKKLGFDRYKFVVQATIGEVKGQAVRVASRCLWDDKNDNFASEEFRTPHMYGIVIVFGMYFE
eukprot:TRINITY_DN2198_c0_g1_i1.p1 TRINITY_DN2198_c0_g1~~TRINITY_DN2198_c0_g1_i1.p1  ORF type:complete len:164 (+),score=30.61 TRINITY_DN2198_c0_g1_i1:41-493(+)